MTTVSDPTNEQVRAQLSDAGVHSLDDLLDALRQSRHGGGPLDGLAGPRRRVVATDVSASRTAPSTPLVVRVDGEVVSPEEARSRPVHMFADVATLERGEVEAFTDPARVTARLGEVQAGGGTTQEHHIPGDQATARFFEHVNCQGASMSLDRRHVKWDLTEEWMGGILWWWTSWNDQVSSVQTSGTHVVLFEHVHMQGATLTVAPHTTLNALSPLGWNDRVSSIANEHSF